MHRATTLTVFSVRRTVKTKNKIFKEPHVTSTPHFFPVQRIYLFRLRFIS